MPLLLQVDLNDGLLAKPTLHPTATNSRVACEDIMLRGADSSPAFAVEQEYSLLPSAPNTSGMSAGGCAYTTSGSAEASAGGWPHSHLPNPMCASMTPPGLAQGEA